MCALTQPHTLKPPPLRGAPISGQAVTRLDYCQFLLSSQINYTITHFAEHAQTWSHDAINRYLRTEKITPGLLWENVRSEVIPSAEGYLLFDDTVLESCTSRACPSAGC